MSTLYSFDPNEDYISILRVAKNRKKELGLENLDYRQLLRSPVIQNSEYELHHIIPNYRLKMLTVANRNISDNIAILTRKEHLLAHYNLCKFETGRFKYSAMLAFTMLCNFSKVNIDKIFDESDQIRDDFLNEIVKSRESYFRSPAHREGSRVAGKKAGEKRKQRFKNDPEFREYILLKMKRTESKRKEHALVQIERNKLLAPWEVNRAKIGPNRKKIPQYWEYFDSIYTGVVKYELSYKLIAKLLNINYRRINNIVRIIKKDINDLPTEFSEYKYRERFFDKYEETLTQSLVRSFEYHSSSFPWDKFSNNGWEYFMEINSEYHKLTKRTAVRYIRDKYGIGLVQTRLILKEIIKLNNPSISTWLFYNDWLYMIEQQQPEVQDNRTKIRC